MGTGRCARCKKCRDNLRNVVINVVKVDKTIHLVWYTRGVDNEFDREIIERLRMFQMDLEDLQARFDELMDDLRHDKAEDWLEQEGQ